MSDVYGTIAQGVNPLQMANQAMQIRASQQSIANQQQQLQANQFALQQAKLQPAYAGIMALRDNPNASWGDVQQALAQSERLGADISGLTQNANEMMAQGGKPIDYIRSTSLRGMPSWEQFGVVGLTADQLSHQIQVWDPVNQKTVTMSLGAAIQQGYNPGIGAGGSFGGGGGGAGGMVPSGGGGFSQPAAPSGLPKEQFLSSVAQRESGDQNIPNRQGPGGTPLSSASGNYQIIDSTWREGKQLAGIDPNQYPTAMSAPKEIQHQVAGALYDKYGETPWAESAPGAQPRPYQVAGTGPVAPPSGAPAAASAPSGGGGLFPGGVISSPSPYLLSQLDQGAKDYTAAQVRNASLGQRTAPLYNAISILRENPTLQTGPGQANINNWAQWAQSLGIDASGLTGKNPNDVTAWYELAKMLKQYDQGIPGSQASDLARLQTEASNPNTEQGRNAIMILAGKAIGNERAQVARYRQFESQNAGTDANGLPRAANRAQMFNFDTADWASHLDPMALSTDVVPPEAIGQYLKGLPTTALVQNFRRTLRDAPRLFPEYFSNEGQQ